MTRKPPGDSHPNDIAWPAHPLSLLDMGLPVGGSHRVHSIAYNKQASTFVAILQPVDRTPPSDQRVFLRARGEPSYSEVKLPDELASVTGVAVCAAAPIVFLNLTKWSTPERRGANNLGLFRVSLPAGLSEKLPDPIDPITAPQSVSVTSVLGASADGSELHLVVSVPTFVALPPEHGYSMGFFLATYSVASGKIEIIDEVLAVVA